MLNTKPWAALGRDLRCQPKKFGHAGHLWDGRLLVALHLCQCIFGHIGFPLRKPTSQIAQSNLVKVADFKKLYCLERRRGVELWSRDVCHFQQHVLGAARNQGSGSAPYAHPQVGRLLWHGRSEQRQVRSYHVQDVPCHDVRDFSEDAAATSLLRHVYRPGVGQCPVSSRGLAQTIASQIPHLPHPVLSAAVHSATGPHQSNLEASPPPGDAQPILPHR